MQHQKSLWKLKVPREGEGGEVGEPGGGWATDVEGRKGGRTPPGVLVTATDRGMQE